MSILRHKKIIFLFLAVAALAAMTAGVMRDRICGGFYVFEGEQCFDDGSLIVMEAVSDVSAAGDAVYEAKLLGVIPIKQVQATVISSKKLAAVGAPFGVKMYTDGVLVVGLSEVETADGIVSPAADAGIEVGDVVISIDGRSVTGNEDIAEIVGASGGRSLEFMIRRDGTSRSVSVKPKSTQSGEKIGMWVRDSTAGIGTITFADPESGVFGGLGHGICDVDTGKLMPLLSGSIVKAEVNGVIKGEAGSPGELTGIIRENEEIGTLTTNSDTGIFGTIFDMQGIDASRVYETGSRGTVSTGRASVLCDVGDGTKEYEIEISRVFSGTSKTKNMAVKVTDRELIEKTGGIVQGMSGSPIIQNGKLIGAVTHVLVNDPTGGYAIFIENMFETASK